MDQDIRNDWLTRLFRVTTANMQSGRNLHPVFQHIFTVTRGGSISELVREIASNKEHNNLVCIINGNASHQEIAELRRIPTSVSNIPLFVSVISKFDLNLIKMLHDLGVHFFFSKYSDIQKSGSIYRFPIDSGVFFSGDLMDHLKESVRTGTQRERIHKLTKREIEVIDLLARNLTSRQIAYQLGVSARTIETHRLNIRRKLGSASASAIWTS
jgi:DNA-binding NarL/FixJ family response regulator